MDLSQLCHPEHIAATRAHQHHCGTRTHPGGETCPARPDTADLAAIWAGRARMAAARQAAAQTLDDLDRQMLARLDNPGAKPR